MVDRSAAGASLAPPPELLPPAGCRGAVSSWPQFIKALQMLKGLNWNSPPWKALARQFGSPDQLIQSLAVNADVLSKGDGPPDVYGRYARLTVVAAGGASICGQTLAQIPFLMANGGDQTTAAIQTALTGEGGLADAASSVADFAERFVAWLKSIDPGAGTVNQALEGFRAADADLTARANIGEALKDRQLSQFQAATREATDGVRAALVLLEASAATVTVTAVFAHLIEAVEALAEGWRNVARTFESVVSDAPAGGLADPAYLTGVLGVDDSAQAWNEFGSVIQAFSASLLVPWDSASTPPG